MNRLSCIVFTIISVTLFPAVASAQVIDCACNSEYSVGDRVVVIVDNPSGASNLPAGTLGTVLCGDTDNWDLYISFDNYTEGHNYNAHCDCQSGDDDADNSHRVVLCEEVAPVGDIECACESHYSVGDQVISVLEFAGLPVGSIGTVLCGGDSPNLLYISWDDMTWGHDNNDPCECQSGDDDEDSSHYWNYCVQVAAFDDGSITVTVDDDGLDYPGADFDNIQDAVDAASDGDEIIVYPGTYTSTATEVVQLANKSIILASTGGAEVTLIDAQNVRRGLETWGADNTSQIAGFTFVNGYDPTQAGGVFLGSGNQHLVDCRIVNCSAGSQGGGLGSQSSHAVIENCTFEDNTAPFGGAVDSTVIGGSSTMSFINCEFLDNQAESSGGLPAGGAVYVQGNPNWTSFTGCTFSGNSAFYGGAYCRANPTVYEAISTFTDCTFESNRALIHGGAAYLAKCNPAFENCTFENNDNMMDPAVEGYGGGILCVDSSPSLVSCTFTGNQSFIGGAMCITAPSSSPQIDGCTFEGNSAVQGGGLYSSSASPALTNCTISGNLATEWGGGVYNVGSPSLTMTNCTLRGNSAISSDVSQNYGGAMYNYESNPVLTDCSIEDNTSGSGGGIYNYASYPVLQSCTVSGNVAKVCGGGMFSEDSIAWLAGTTFCANQPDNIIGAWVDQGGNVLSPDCEPDDPGFCVGDTNIDYNVDILDLLYVIAVWNTDNAAGDINEDGWVDILDLLEVLSNWGQCNEA